MQIPKLKLKYNTRKQLDKIFEEYLEVQEELNREIIIEDDLIEECFDVIVATFNLIFMFDTDEEYINECWEYVRQKLERRGVVDKYINL